MIGNPEAFFDYKGARAKIDMTFVFQMTPLVACAGFVATIALTAVSIDCIARFIKATSERKALINKNRIFSRI